MVKPAPIMADGNNFRGYEAEDIIKCGYMMIKRPPSSGKVRIKAWQSKFFVLRDTTLNGPQRLEYYKDDSSFDLQKSPEHCFYLDSVVFVGESRSSKSHNHAIMVVCCKQGPLTLACDSEEVNKDWIQALNNIAVKVNRNDSSLDHWVQTAVDDSLTETPEITRHDLEEQVQRETSRTNSGTTGKNDFHVITRLTPHSEKNNIRGDYMLCFTGGDLVLHSVNTNRAVVSWPVSHLRSFKSESAAIAGKKDMQLLTLNAGSRSATGEGIFQFFTKHADAIADEIRQRSQHMATLKRETFLPRSFSGDDVKSSSPALPAKRLQRGSTAPPKRSPVASTKKYVTVSLTDGGQCPDRQTENGSNIDLRPRSATDPSVEKLGDDEVFFLQESSCDENNAIPESDSCAYIDLVSDKSAQPIHISDPVSSRKAAGGSQASASSFTADNGSMPASSRIGNFSGTHWIAEENEMDSEGYIKCEALETGPEGNTIERSGHDNECFATEIWSKESEMSCIVGQNWPKCPVGASVQIASSDSRINKKMREQLLAQIEESAGGSFQPKPTLQRERSLDEGSIFLPASGTLEKEAGWANDSVDALLEKARDPKSSKELLDQIIAQMEKPQQNDVNQLFPASTRQRNSIATVSLETSREVQLNLIKHAVVGKRASAGDGFFPRSLSPGLPYSPSRSDFSELSRRRGYSSVGDLSEEVPKRPDLVSSHRSTFFAKGMGSVNPQTLSMAPLRTNIAGHLGGEAAIHARLIEKTEIRDELAHSSAIRNKSVAEATSSCLIGADRAICSIADETMHNSINSVDDVDQDGQFEATKRKEKKATKFVKKVFKLSPKVKRSSIAEPRESNDQSSPPSERARRESLSPANAVELQRRLSGSEVNTPETSPKTERKNSRTSPKCFRKISMDGKGKKEESSPSKTLRKVSKGDLKKGETSPSRTLRKVSKDDLKKGETSPSRTLRKVSKDDLKKEETSPSRTLRKVSKDDLKKGETSPSRTLRKVSKGDLKKEEISPSRTLRKVSKDDLKKEETSPSRTLRKVSKDDLKKGETSPSRTLRKVSKGDLKKEEISPSRTLRKVSKDDLKKGETSPSRTLRKVSKDDLKKEELTKRDSPNNEIAFLENCRKVSEGEISKEIGEVGLTASSHHDDDQSGDPSDTPGSADNPAPALPPRKKSEAPPLPPRLPKSSSLQSAVLHSTQSSQSQHGGRTPQPRLSSTGRLLSGNGLKEDALPPPPIPPRNNQSKETRAKSDGRKPAGAPVIQLTCSSPENQDDALGKHNSDSEESTIDSGIGKSSDVNPPIISAEPELSLTHPVPLRPPKVERSTQAKDYYRNNPNQHVEAISSDFEDGHLDDDHVPARSIPNGRTDARKEAAQTGEELAEEHITSEEVTLKESGSAQTQDIALPVLSQKEAKRLKINLMQESSFDEEIPCGSNSTDDQEEESKARRPSTPLNVQQNMRALSSVIIN